MSARDGFARVAALRDLPEGTLLGVVTPAGERVCLLNDRGAVLAVGDECPHQGFALSAGELVGDGTIECVWHGARFDCRSGAVVRGPAEEGLTHYDVRVEGGDVYVGRRTA
ncbi:MAG TPA: Rieske (2Fe-2S) protein [Gemmatimonadaceae bacterium]|nr:Rieske (2Fe-2S) protein [Gemmatimonadaceae bacterium]